VYFKEEADAAKAKEGLAGLTMAGRSLRIDFSYTRKAHSPTPGRYLGRSSRRRNNYRNDRYDRDRRDNRDYRDSRDSRDDRPSDRYDRRSPTDDR